MVSRLTGRQGLELVGRLKALVRKHVGESNWLFHPCDIISANNRKRGWCRLVLGIGVDTVDIHRIGEVYQRRPQQFIERLLTPAERMHWQATGAGIESLAGIWAAKEAVAKALGCGFSGFGLSDVVIVHDQLGKPGVVLMAGALHEAEVRSIKQVLISISHSSTQAVAFAVALGVVN
jgi:holo-[acyl-carrier protein] synthase